MFNVAGIFGNSRIYYVRRFGERGERRRRTDFEDIRDAPGRDPGGIYSQERRSWRRFEAYACANKEHTEAIGLVVRKQRRHIAKRLLL